MCYTQALLFFIFRGNSMEENNKPKIPKQTPVASATQKKENKLLSVFKPGDIKAVSKSVLTSVIVPAIKKLIDDVISEGVHSMLYPNEGPRQSSGGVYVNYATSFSQRNRTPVRPTAPIQSWGSDFGIGNVRFPTRGDAEMVLQSMRDLLMNYPLVTVATFFELSNVSTENYQANSYGWTNLDNARVDRTIDGMYRLILPRPMPID